MVPGVQGCELLGWWTQMLRLAGMEVHPGMPDGTTKSREAPETPTHYWTQDGTFRLCLQQLVGGLAPGTPVTQVGQRWQEGGS